MNWACKYNDWDSKNLGLLKNDWNLSKDLGWARLIREWLGIQAYTRLTRT